MTKECACAADQARPAETRSTTSLQTHLAHLQYLATRLAGVMAAVSYLENADECRDGQAALIFLAEELACQLNTSLDSVNIPKGQIV